MSYTKRLMSLIMKKSNLVEMQRIIHLKSANLVSLDISFYTPSASHSPFACQALLWPRVAVKMSDEASRLYRTGGNST